MTEYKFKKIFSHIPTLKTEYLTLRKIDVSDYKDMYDYARRPEVTRYLLWDEHPNEKYTRRYLEFLQTQYRKGLFYDWGVIHRGDGRMIGTCGFTSVDIVNMRAEVGYVINPDYRGNGFAGEALDAVLDFGFNVIGFHRIEAHYIVGNDDSRRVMEKCGMTFEGIMRDYMEIKGRYRDIGICSVLASEFIKKQDRQNKSDIG